MRKNIYFALLLFANLFYNYASRTIIEKRSTNFIFK